MHPLDIFFGNKNTFGGYVSIYSSNGDLTGYKRATYIPEYGTTKLNSNIIVNIITNRIDNIVSDQMMKTVEIYGSKMMFKIASKVSVVSNIYDAISIANNSISINGTLSITGPVMKPPSEVLVFSVVENFNPFILK